MHGRGQQTTDGHSDLQTNLAQRGQVGEKVFKVEVAEAASWETER